MELFIIVSLLAACILLEIDTHIHFLWNLGATCTKTNIMLILVCVFSVAIQIFVLCGPFFSLPLLYLTILGSHAIQGSLCPIEKISAFQMYNTRFISLTALHLFLIGFCAILTVDNASDVLLDLWLRTISFCAAILLSTSTKISLRSSITSFKQIIRNHSVHDFRFFHFFTFLCIIYLLAQSILVQLDNSMHYIPVFLMCTNFVVLLLMITYIRNIYQISQSIGAEQSHHSLSESLIQADDDLIDLRRYVYNDELTGAFNRSYLLETLNRLNESDTTYSVVYCDLDRLKYINDHFGHQAGDLYLRQFSQSMISHIRPDDILARLGGDEFVIVLPECTRVNAENRIQQISDDIYNIIPEFPLSFSFGVAESNEASDLHTLLTLADHRMYLAKRARKEANSP